VDHIISLDHVFIKQLFSTEYLINRKDLASIHLKDAKELKQNIHKSKTKEQKSTWHTLRGKVSGSLHKVFFFKNCFISIS
jgi:GTPase SAR1 family protein